ncbi:hypothetical protein SAMN05421806_1265 [Streptomyces indicus]|uniref:WD40-like Beta Propeller Repeat n=2 Tax=Streptomyces indicus TaxID=417292 RepID=A0A1G9IYH2_9ACTN|nr:hypothetical protein SAMN05421806_1265 [Streptomyces indicus]
MHHVPDFDYQHLAFSPDGDALWAWPAHNTTNAWDRSDTIDLRSGTVRSGRAWDTGIVEHPGGGLVATYNSDQGATLVLFARTDLASGPLRFLRRALIIDVDGYEAPVFSSDGRRFAIRGNAYEETLSVYEFPTLRLMLFTTLGDDEPDRLSSATGEGADVADWSRHNIAFDARPGVLWIGRPDGTLLELNLDEETVTPHPLLGGAPVTALGRLVTGDLVAATATGEVVLVAVAGGPHIPDREAMVEVVRTFVDSTSEVPDDDQDLERHLVLADGERSWDQDDLDSVTEASSADPTWLQVQAAVNKMRADGR